MSRYIAGNIITNEINILQNVILNNDSGATGNVLIKVDPSNQIWSNLPATSIIPGLNNQNIVTVKGVPTWMYGISSYGKYSNDIDFNTFTRNQNVIPFNTILISHPAFSYNKKGIFKCTFGGNYKFTFQTTLKNNTLSSSGNCLIRILKNKSIYSEQRTNTISENHVLFIMMDIISCVPNDTIEFASIRDTGTGAITTSSTHTSLLIE